MRSIYFIRTLTLVYLVCMPALAFAIPGFHINNQTNAEKAVRLYAENSDKFAACAYQAQLDKHLWQLALASYNYLQKKPSDPERECSFGMAFLGSQQVGTDEQVPPADEKKLQSLYGAAIVAIKDAALKLPNSYTAHLSYGKYLQYGVSGMQKVPAMLNEFKKAVALRPDLGETHYYLGLAYFGSGSYTAATATKVIEQLKKAVHLDPRLADSYFYISAVFDWKAVHNLQKERYFLNKALELDPSLASRPDVKKDLDYLQNGKLNVEIIR